VDLRHRIRSPHPPRDEQERGVDGPHREPVVARQIPDQVALLRGRILGHHELDRVEPGGRDVPERLAQGLAEPGCGGKEQLRVRRHRRIPPRARPFYGRPRPARPPVAVLPESPRLAGYPSPAVTESDNEPRWSSDRRAYEVWFLTMHDPATGQGYWIRSTLHVPVEGAPY